MPSYFEDVLTERSHQLLMECIKHSKALDVSPGYNKWLSEPISHSTSSSPDRIIPLSSPEDTRALLQKPARLPPLPQHPPKEPVGAPTQAGSQPDTNPARFSMNTDSSPVSPSKSGTFKPDARNRYPRAFFRYRNLFTSNHNWAKKRPRTEGQRPWCSASSSSPISPKVVGWLDGLQEQSIYQSSSQSQIGETENRTDHTRRPESTSSSIEKSSSIRKIERQASTHLETRPATTSQSIAYYRSSPPPPPLASRSRFNDHQSGSSANSLSPNMSTNPSEATEVKTEVPSFLSSITPSPETSDDARYQVGETSRKNFPGNVDKAMDEDYGRTLEGCYDVMDKSEMAALNPSGKKGALPPLGRTSPPSSETVRDRPARIVEDLLRQWTFVEVSPGISGDKGGVFSSD